MNDLDTLLREEGARWREGQLPPVVDWTQVEAPAAGGRTRSALLAVAAAVAAVVVGSLLWRPWTTGEVAEPTPTPSGSASLPSAAGSVVPWLGDPITPPSAHPHATAPPLCDLSQFHGTSRALGGNAVEIRLSGADVECAVPGHNGVSLMTAGGASVAVGVDPGTYGGLGWVHPGEDLILRISSGPELVLCPLPPVDMTATISGKGSSVAVEGIKLSACNLVASRLFADNDTPPLSDPRAALVPHIVAPDTAESGSTLDFQVKLYNLTDFAIPLDDGDQGGACPWYQVWVGPTQPDTAYSLNCASTVVPARGEVTFAMRADVPDGLTGPQPLTWSAYLDWTYGGDSTLEATATVTVSGAEASEAPSGPSPSPSPSASPAGVALQSCGWDEMDVAVAVADSSRSLVRDVTFTPSRRCTEPRGDLTLLRADGTPVDWEWSPTKLGANADAPFDALLGPSTPLHLTLMTIPGSCTAPGGAKGVVSLTIEGNASSKRVDGLDFPAAEGCGPLPSEPYIAEQAPAMAGHVLVLGTVHLFGGPMGADGKQRLNGEPGPDFPVSISANGKELATATSDSDGNFSFLVTPGTYSFGCSDADQVEITDYWVFNLECDVPVP